MIYGKGTIPKKDLIYLAVFKDGELDESLVCAKFTSPKDSVRGVVSKIMALTIS